jgi:hypothetical protein
MLVTGRSPWSIVGLSLLAVSAVALLALYHARPDLDPIATPISFYNESRSRWLLRLVLMTDGLGVIAIAASMAEGGMARSAVRLIAVGGAGLLLAAIVEADPWFPWERPLTVGGIIHAIGAGVAVLTLPPAARIFTRRIVNRTRLTRALDVIRDLFALTLLGFAAATLLWLVTGRSPHFLGLAEQLLFALAIAWLVIASRVSDQRA